MPGALILPGVAGIEPTSRSLAPPLEYWVLKAPVLLPSQLRNFDHEARGILCVLYHQETADNTIDGQRDRGHLCVHTHLLEGGL